MAVPTASAGSPQTFPFAQLPKLVTLDGSASSSPNGAITTYKWYRLYRPAGSSAALSSDAVAGPTFTADLPGSYLLFLEVRDATGVWSERNPLKAPNTAFVLITARTQALDLSLPATGQRNYTLMMLGAITALETTVGLADAHLGAGADKHADSQITYTRPDGSKKNIGAGDDDLRKAIDKLDDTIALLSGLATTVKTSVVAAINEVNTAAVAAKAAVDAAVASSAGAGDAGKLVKLNGSGIIASSIHGNQGGGSYAHPLVTNATPGFMYAGDFTKLGFIEDNADVTDETNVLAALAFSGATKSMGGGKISNAAQPSADGDGVALTHAGQIDGQFMRDGEQKLPISNGQTVTVDDICEFAVGGRFKKAAGSSRHPCGVAKLGGTGDVGGTVLGRFQDRGVVDLVVVNGGATVIGRRVNVSATPNQIDDAGLDVVSGTLGIALETVTGDGILTCKVYLQPIGGQ